ncbi:14749_t:CDS:2 [Funneliformis mosseae]|uniref:14749_t:CDS:1 n=1 Tax=Funneliformis mosseae TaxID=27381 RepID=A0A9N9ABM0_FUNMO|nr:14749_t:CDS:2 [Funneliformis mosseae]
MEPIITEETRTYKWFQDLSKPTEEEYQWTRALITRYQGIVTPYGTSGIIVTLPGFRPILVNTKGCESIHAWDVGSLWNSNRYADKYDYIQQQQADSELESRKNTSIAMVSFESCHNRKRIQTFEPPLGELCRVGSLVGTSGTIWETEEPTTPCHLVLPDNILT